MDTQEKQIMKKQLKLIIIIAVATAVLALALWGISLIPKDSDGVTSGVVQTVDIYSVERDDVVSVEIKSENDEFSITKSESNFAV